MNRRIEASRYLDEVRVHAHLVQEDLKLGTDPVPAILAIAGVSGALPVEGGARRYNIDRVVSARGVTFASHALREFGKRWRQGGALWCCIALVVSTRAFSRGKTNRYRVVG